VLTLRLPILYRRHMRVISSIKTAVTYYRAMSLGYECTSRWYDSHAIAISLLLSFGCRSSTSTGRIWVAMGGVESIIDFSDLDGSGRIFLKKSCNKFYVYSFEKPANYISRES